MSKKLNADSIMNELSSGSVFFQKPTEDVGEKKVISKRRTFNEPAKENKHVESKPHVDKKVAMSTEKSTHPSENTVTTNESTRRQAKPKGYQIKAAFYLIDTQDKAIDKAVANLRKAFAGLGLTEIDRSFVIRSLFEKYSLDDKEIFRKISESMKTDDLSAKRMGKHKSFYITQDQRELLDLVAGNLQKENRELGKITISELFRHYLSVFNPEREEVASELVENTKKALIAKLSA